MDTGYTFHQIAKVVQMDIRTVKKVLSMSLIEQEKYLMSTMNISHTHKKLQKEKRICEVRQLYKQGNSKRSIVRQLGLDHCAISKYLNPKTNRSTCKLRTNENEHVRSLCRRNKTVPNQLVYICSDWYHSSRERLQRLCLYCAQLYFQTEKIFI